MIKVLVCAWKAHMHLQQIIVMLLQETYTKMNIEFIGTLAPYYW